MDSSKLEQKIVQIMIEVLKNFIWLLLESSNDCKLIISLDLKKKHCYCHIIYRLT